MNLSFPRRRWFQFSLLSFFIVITLAAIWLGWTMQYLRALEGQWVALERIGAETESLPDGSGISYTVEPATVLGSSLPSRINPKWQLVRSIDAGYEVKTRNVAHEITAFGHLVQLELGDPSLTDYDLKSLGELRELKDLTVSSRFVTGKFLGGGTLANTLEVLRLESQELDQQGVRELGKCTHLKKLFLYDDHAVGIRQGISDWSFLNDLTELEELTLFGDYPDDALAALAKMPGLRKLAIQSGRLTDKGVAEIAKCQSIEELQTGLVLTEKISVSIKSMKNLKSVLFMGSEIMPMDLEKARPGLKIIFPTFGPGPGSP